MNRHVHHALLACIITGTCFSPALAQTAEPIDEAQTGGRIVPFLEGTDIVLNNHRDKLVFEARIAPHLILKHTFGDVIALSPVTGKMRSTYGYSLSATPGVVLRMYKEPSSPVRTPSYMPRVNFQILLARDVERAAARFLHELADPSRPAPIVTFWEFHTTVGHHSNGQDGCFFKDVTREEDCKLPPKPKQIAGADGAGTLPGAPSQRRPIDQTPELQRVINRKDGSFSTNYARVGINWRRNVLNEKRVARKEWSLGADFESHFLMDDNIVNYYGRERFSFRAAVASRKEGAKLCAARREVKAWATYIAGSRPSTVPPVSVSLQATCYPLPSENWGVFIKGYRGQDYYNLGYLDRITHVEVGITFGQDGFFRFK